jgi:RNase adapter protein RapZ
MATTKREGGSHPPTLHSFGYRYGPPTEPGVVVIDVRDRFRNPFRVASLRDLDGLNEAVQADIRRDPAFNREWAHLYQQVVTAMSEGALAIYIGCYGGRHRSVYLVEELAKTLTLKAEHRDRMKKALAHQAKRKGGKPW